MNTAPRIALSDTLTAHNWQQWGKFSREARYHERGNASEKARFHQISLRSNVNVFWLSNYEFELKPRWKTTDGRAATAALNHLRAAPEHRGG